LVVYGRLKTEENFKLLAIKVVTVAYKKRLLTRGSKYSDSTCKHLVFGKLVAEERWSLKRGGRNQRFNCIWHSPNFENKNKNKKIHSL